MEKMFWLFCTIMALTLTLTACGGGGGGDDGGDGNPPPSQDTTPPTVTGFTMPATSSSQTVTISSLTATDNVGVTGYQVTVISTAPSASSAGWSATGPTAIHFVGSGSQTAYAWAKDAAGNVSASRSATVIIAASGEGAAKTDVQ
jgi:hypothetical protein